MTRLDCPIDSHGIFPPCVHLERGEDEDITSSSSSAWPIAAYQMDLLRACFSRRANDKAGESGEVAAGSSGKSSVSSPATATTTGTSSPHVGAGSKPGCVFCDVSESKGFKIVLEDDEYVAFQDRAPSAKRHFLVIPKHHVGNVKMLRQADVALVRAMHDFGQRVLDKAEADDGFGETKRERRACFPVSFQWHVDGRRFGFHIPPFRSVDHLHLHCLSLPFLSHWQSWKYPIAPSRGAYSKGWSWFVEVEQCVRILDKGERVSVCAC